MARTKAAEVATGVRGVVHVKTRLPWGLMGPMSATGQPSWGRLLMGRRGLPGDGVQHAGQLALEGLSMLLGLFWWAPEVSGLGTGLGWGIGRG